MDDLRKTLESIARTDLFEVAAKQEHFVGNPFLINYESTSILTCDDWKNKVGGIAQGCFLLAFYDNELDKDVREILLLRALHPCSIPSDSDVIKSRIEFFKEELKTSGPQSEIDEFTRFEFSCSGLECAILGTFYRNLKGEIEFGADIENFYSPHLYRVFKPMGEYLEYIVNIRDADGPLKPESNFQIGTVRYSSSRKSHLPDVAKNDERVFMHTKDILGKRTALFGMTRTGKSNTVKKLIEATEELSRQATQEVDGSFEDNLTPFNEHEVPKQEVGQIIFDINGEYANRNLQDGTAIFEKYESRVTRYSVLEKPGFKVMKVNFYNELTAGMEMIRGYFKQLGKQADYVENFLGVNLEAPETEDRGELIRYERRVAAYRCCLKQAGFLFSDKDEIRFQGVKDIDEQIVKGKSISPAGGIGFSDAVMWFSQVWKNYKNWDYLTGYEGKNGREWADNELKALLVFLTGYRRPDETGPVSGYIKLKPLVDYHSPASVVSFESEIERLVRTGKIVIVDLSQGDEDIQRLYSEKICRAIFYSSLKKFIAAEPNNFIQFYFEEAHNLFPKKEEKDLSQIYNRIAKEGAKLNLGMIYATQEVSSISSNILKNTQNWFISHLNNEDEVRELRKFYDFSDFADSLIRFSARSDKGFVRMKTYSNPFVVPIQVELFK
jgi:DNA helicase HerA-like ATPase